MSLTFLVSGCSRGIGYGVTKYLLEQGHKVYGFSRKVSTDVGVMLSNYKATFSYATCDLTSNLDVQQYLYNMKAAHPSGLHFDGILLNAGANLRSEPVAFHKHFEINCFSQWWLLGGLADRLLNSEKYCHIVGMGSFLAPHGSDFLPAYAVSKAAFECMLRCNQLHYQNAKIPWRVSVIYPGRVATDGNPRREVLPTELQYREVADVAPLISSILCETLELCDTFIREI